MPALLRRRRRRGKVMQVYISLTPRVESASLSSSWLQMSTCTPTQGPASDAVKDIKVGRCKLNPGLKAPCFQPFVT